MFKKRHILPIFLLYFLTSSAFLVFFGSLFYERERSFIIDESVFELRDIRREIQMKIHESGELTSDDLKDFNAVAINLRTKEVLKKDFEVPKDMPSRYFDGKNTLAQFKIHARMMKNEYIVFLKSKDLTPKLNAIKLKISLISICVLVVILLIAYFIVRLSLRPLYEKIEFLDGFIRDTTHEINTPLSVILMSIELFKSNPDKYLGNIKTAALTISNLYEDLVALKMNKNGAQEIKESVNLSQMLDERIEYFSASLERKNINLSTDIDEVELETSKFKIRKIIDNLLSNAVKYCDENGFVSINLKREFLSVTNSGDGIAKENLPRIFELYTRFDKRNGGFGVGLNLVKKFVGELGFSVSCKSGEGITEFRVYFK